MRTEGLSIKYPTLTSSSIVFLDSAGVEEPILETGDKKKEPVLKAEEITEKIRKMSRDKQLSELFLKEFVFHISEVVLVMVGQLTYEEQKMIMRFKKNLSDKHMIIVHNLMNFVQKDQVERYIEENLKKVVTFNLQERTFGNRDPKKNNRYFVEYFYDYKKNKHEIVHLILANNLSEDTKNYYNESSIDYIRRYISTKPPLSSFNLFDQIKNYLSLFSYFYLEKPIEKKTIISTYEKLYINSNEEIEFKPIAVDEQGITNSVASSFIPGYSYVIDKTIGKLILAIEVSGDYNISSKVFLVDRYFNFQIKGTSLREENKELEDLSQEKVTKNFV